MLAEQLVFSDGKLKQSWNESYAISKEETNRSEFASISWLAVGSTAQHYKSIAHWADHQSILIHNSHLAREGTRSESTDTFSCYKHSNYVVSFMFLSVVRPAANVASPFSYCLTKNYGYILWRLRLDDLGRRVFRRGQAAGATRLCGHTRRGTAGLSLELVPGLLQSLEDVGAVRSVPRSHVEHGGYDATKLRTDGVTPGQKLLGRHDSTRFLANFHLQQ